jgi:hypothetical protein
VELYLGRALKIGIDKFTQRIYTRGKKLNWNFIGFASYSRPQNLAVLIHLSGLSAGQGTLPTFLTQRRRAARGKIIRTKEESIRSLMMSAQLREPVIESIAG